MNWKTVMLAASGATIGTVGAHSLFNGFDLTMMLVVGFASLLGAVLVGFIVSLGKRK